MRNEYSVGSLLMLLLRRWKIIIGAGILAGILSIPISEASYRNALAQYEKYTENDVIEPSSIEITFGLQTKYGDQIELTDKLARLVSVDYLQRAWREYNNGKDTLFPYESETKAGSVIIKNGSENAAGFAKYYSKVLPEYISAEYEGDYVIISQMSEQINGMTRKGEAQAPNMAEILLQRPDKKEDYIKITLTAFLFGAFICSALLLVTDFCSPVVKSKEELAAYGQVAEYENCVPDIPAYGRSAWLLQRKKIETKLAQQKGRLIVAIKMYKTPICAITDMQEKYNDNLVFVVKK